MSNIKPNSIVNLSCQRIGDLRYPPSDLGGIFAIAAHKGALKSTNKSTQVVQIKEGALVWVGAIDEEMVIEVPGAIGPDVRSLLANHLLRGPALWEILPSVDLWSRTAPPDTTIYQGARPWIVLGETAMSILAAPLNHCAPGEVMATYQSFVSQTSLQAMVTPSPRNSKLEMNHIWSLPKKISGVGSLAARARAALKERIVYFYGLTP